MIFSMMSRLLIFSACFYTVMCIPEIDTDGFIDNSGASYVDDDEFLWKDGVVVYNISSDFTSSEREKLAEAMDIITSALEPGCITFTELKNAPRNSSIPQDKLNFVSIKKVNTTEVTCQSTIGSKKRKGHDEQDIRPEMILSKECFESEGTIAHEFLHTLGAAHEHIRQDRNLFMEITVEQCDMLEAKYGKKKYLQFTRKPKFDRARGTPYDFYSIMHYTNQQLNALAGIKDNTTRILTVREPYKTKMKRSEEKEIMEEKRIKLTSTDAVEVSKNYKCSILPWIIKDYVSYLKKLTKLLINEIKKCVDSREEELKRCLLGYEVAEEYMLEWESNLDVDDNQVEFDEYKGILEDIGNTAEKEDRGILDEAAKDPFIDVELTQDRNREGAKCP